MLVNKRKNQKKNTKENITSEETIQSFRSWIRKLEQSTNSLSSRLSAVEKRISKRKTDLDDNTTDDYTFRSPVGDIFKKIKNDSSENIEIVEEFSNAIDNEFSILQEELTQQKIEFKTIKDQIKELNNNVNVLSEEIKKNHDFSTNYLKDFKIRLEKIEQREPPSLKIGRMEIPIEITGLIGGILALIIAFMVSMGLGDIALSPISLAIIGLILIGSALLKAFHFGSVVPKSYKKSSKISRPVEETQ